MKANLSIKQLVNTQDRTLQAGRNKGMDGKNTSVRHIESGKEDYVRILSEAPAYVEEVT